MTSRGDGPSWPYGPAVLGGGNFGGIGGARAFLERGMDEPSSFTAMDEAANLGLVLFDTAERYGGGESERLIGRWLRSRPSAVTDQVRISTKVGPPWVDRRDGRFDSEYITRIFNGSLERLGLERVDLLYTHAPDDHPERPPGGEVVPIEVTLEALESLRADGRFVLLGASNIDARQLRDAIDAADRLGVVGYQVIQNGFNLLDPNGYADVREMARQHGMAFTAYSALGAGVLTGKYRRDAPAPSGSLVDIGYLDDVASPIHDAMDRLRAAASSRGVPTGALALAWLLHHPDVDALTTAPARTSPHFELLAAALELDLDAEEANEFASWFVAASTDASDG